MIILSRHFCDNWLDRVGYTPTAEFITQVLRESVPVQPGRDLRTKRGNHYRVFAIYWHPGLDVIIKVDEKKSKAVTVLSKKIFEDRNQNRPCTVKPKGASCAISAK